jgi:hypothetical protein
MPAVGRRQVCPGRPAARQGGGESSQYDPPDPPDPAACSAGQPVSCALCESLCARCPLRLGYLLPRPGRRSAAMRPDNWRAGAGLVPMSPRRGATAGKAGRHLASRFFWFVYIWPGSNGCLCIELHKASGANLWHPGDTQAAGSAATKPRLCFSTGRARVSRRGAAPALGRRGSGGRWG